MTDLFEPVIVVITGRPIAKGRGRVGVVSGRPMIFTPKNTRKWERDARQLGRIKMGDRPLISGPVHVTVRAVFPIPESWPAWKRELAQDGTLLHTSPPDGDNVLKAAKDAMKGIVYLDDRQVVISTVEKCFGGRPAVVIGIVPVEGVPSNVKSRPAEGKPEGVLLI